MLLEFAIGQKMRMSAVRLWKEIHPALFGIGICCIVVSLFLCLYYIVIITWCLFYFFISMQKELPWQKEVLCPRYPAYNSLQQAEEMYQRNVSYYERRNNLTLSDLKTLNASKEILLQKQKEIANFSDCCVIDPPQWYFYTKVLEVSTDIEDYSQGLNGKLVGCLILAWVIVYLCVVKGIKSTGKVSRSASQW